MLDYEWFFWLGIITICTCLCKSSSDIAHVQRFVAVFDRITLLLKYYSLLVVCRVHYLRLFPLRIIKKKMSPHKNEQQNSCFKLIWDVSSFCLSFTWKKKKPVEVLWNRTCEKCRYTVVQRATRLHPTQDQMYNPLVLTRTYFSFSEWVIIWL